MCTLQALAGLRRIASEIHDAAAHFLGMTMPRLAGARSLLQRLGADRRATCP